MFIYKFSRPSREARYAEHECKHEQTGLWQSLLLLNTIAKY